MGYVGRSDAQTFGETSGEIGGEALEVGVLPRAGYEHTGNAPLHKRTHHLLRAIHYLRTRKLIEITRLPGIKFTLLGVGGLTTESAQKETIDGLGAGHPLVEVELLAGTWDAEFGSHTVPRGGVEAH